MLDIPQVDIPLSYGIFDVQQEPKSLNMCEFDWDPTKEVGVYIKVKMNPVSFAHVLMFCCVVLILAKTWVDGTERLSI